MAHNSNCAQATQPGCECDCGGAMHGCQGAFDTATAAERVREYAAEREEDLRARRVTRKEGAIGCAKADVVHWLYRDVGLLNCSRTTQEVAFEDVPGVALRGMVLRALAERLGPQRMREFQEWARETHFWCELLAQLACALVQYEEIRGRMFRAAEASLSQMDGPPLPEGLRRDEVMGTAVQWAWRYVLQSIVATQGVTLMTLLSRGDVEPLVRPVRVIAVLMCPDASRHPAVRRHCWEPIVRSGDARMRQVVRDRLTQAFPEDPWFRA